MPRLARFALHEQVAAELRKSIVRGDLAPGARIAEQEVADRLGVSRTPLREAFKLLAAQGLVDLRPNRGARVAPLDLVEIAHLFEVVGGLERQAAELAAVRIDAVRLRQLESLQTNMEQHHETQNLHRYFDVNQEIHNSIVAAAENPVLTATHQWLMGRVERARFMALYAPERWNESVAEHRLILAALANGEGDRAGRLMEAHVRRTGEVVARTLSSAPSHVA